MEWRSLKFFKKTLIPILAFLYLSLLFGFSHPDVIIMDEICNNGIDDDDDGLIDLNDPECNCPIVEPESLIPNPSFEETDCCPTMQSEVSCASYWEQASYPTTDFINTCGYMGWSNSDDNFPPPQPFPDGDGIIGFRDGVIEPPIPPNLVETFDPTWKEYTGICLPLPIEADSFYRLQFYTGFVNPYVSPPITMSLFGAMDCTNLPFGGSDPANLIGCPTNSEGWVELGSVSLSSNNGNEWILTTIDIVPEEDITALAIGPDCEDNLASQNLYYFLDNIILDEIENFELNLTPVAHPCDADFAIEVPFYPDLSYQWYRDGIALAGETMAQLSQLYGAGNYQVRTDDGSECRLSGVYAFETPVVNTTIAVAICDDDSFIFNNQELTTTGIYMDTLLSSKNCDSIVTLELDVQGTVLDTVSALLFEGGVFEIQEQEFNQAGEYLITLRSKEFCKVLTLLQLEYYKIFIPDVFSPNNDGVNDTFTILAENGLIQTVELTVFDRWGGIVYRGPKWEGRYESSFVNPGVYVYTAEITLNNLDKHIMSGSVTVVR